MKKFIKNIYKKSVYILGINEALGASAALLKDGEVIAAAQEERFSRVKNHSGFPQKSISFCCKFAGIDTDEIDLVVLSYIDPYVHFTSKRAKEVSDFAPPLLRKLRDMAPWVEYRFPLLNYITDIGRSLYYLIYQPKNQKQQITDISNILKISENKIVRVNHHLSHAYAAYYANPKFSNKPTLVITCDGAGDGLCASVSIAQNGKLHQIASVPHTHSLGLFYASITSHLGLKAHEDEYKVMGLAPYGVHGNINKIYQILEKLLWVEGLEFKSSVPSRHFNYFLNTYLKNIRFDYLASAAQKFFEDRLVEWINNAINLTNIHNVTFSGGVFLNVKANLEIIKRTKVKQIFFLSSPGDDTNAFGACYYGYEKIINQRNELFKCTPISSLYLGPKASDNDVILCINKYNFPYQKLKNPAKTMSHLLAKGDIVARFCDRMEFGARALGNRSILSDPRNISSIEKINSIIKMRDFWMPFAPTILDRYALKYLVNPKKHQSPYMTVAFDTTNLGRKHLAAAIHPHDKTARAQVLKKSVNPDYYNIIDEFAKITGVGAVLNTSFNIHGEPIVSTPDDAISTFKRSGLQYLIINNYLVNK